MNGGGPNNAFSGPVAKLTFSGTAGQYVTLSVGASRGFFYGLNMYYGSGSTRTCLGSCGTGNSGGTNGYEIGPLPITGTYTVYVWFQSALYSTFNATLWNSTALAINSGATSASFDLGDLSYRVLTFSATAGQAVTFHASPTSCFRSWQLLNPNGGIQNSGPSVTSGAAGLGTMPTSGTYKLIVTAFFAVSFSGTSGTPPLVYGPIGSYSADWSPSYTTCSLQVTSP